MAATSPGPSEAELRATVATGLAEARARRKTIYDMVAQAAPCVGRSKATLYRWAQKGRPPGRRGGKPYELTKADKQALRESRGCFADAWETRRKKGLAVSLPTFTRACKRAFTTGELAVMREGYAAHVRHTTRIKRTDLFAGNIEWQIDAKQLDIQVAVPRYAKLKRPWITVVIDAHDRGVRGFSVSVDHPNEDDVLTALYDAVRISDELPLGGIPDRLVTDNGLEFTSDRVIAALVGINVVAYATDAYAPHQKGVIERFFLTLIKGWEKKQPLWVDGPRMANKELVDRRPPLEFDEVVEGLTEYFRFYNEKRPHSALHGKTPKEVFDAGPAPRLASDEQLRSMLFHRVEKTVTTHGIRHNNKQYLAAKLDDLVGDTVIVAIPPHDPDYVEVFDHQGDFMLTAYYPPSLSAEEVDQLLGARKTTTAKRLENLTGRARAKARDAASKGPSRREKADRRKAGDVQTATPQISEAAAAGLESLGLTVFGGDDTPDTEVARS